MEHSHEFNVKQTNLDFFYYLACSSKYLIPRQQSQRGVTESFKYLVEIYFSFEKSFRHESGGRGEHCE
jgi:hypothetical protein